MRTTHKIDTDEAETLALCGKENAFFFVGFGEESIM